MDTSNWTLRAEAVTLPLAERFTISSGSWDAADNVFVRVGFQGREGIGESSPDGRWQESCESVIAQIEAVDLGELAGPFDLEGLGHLLPAGSARAALDIAMHDLAGKLASVSVSQLLGVAGRRLPPTSLTLPISDPREMVARARRLADHPVLKMKVGFDGDVDAVRAVRTVFKGTLRIDANEGWGPEEAIERLQALERFDIELCEQPIAAGRHDSLREVSAATSIPVFADEDVSTAADVAALAGVVDGVNLKLRKTGGIREAFKAMAVARAHGLGLMLGCDLESGVAATAQAHLTSLVDHADIDGPLLLARDPWPGVGYERGMLVLPLGPGLGVEKSQ
ncbi:MAG: dipeptide epimerase [Actinobacteria bacterium]|nr:dipeptide epimerase [Actinomycetota bacterium]